MRKGSKTGFTQIGGYVAVMAVMGDGLCGNWGKGIVLC